MLRQIKREGFPGEDPGVDARNPRNGWMGAKDEIDLKPAAVEQLERVDGIGCPGSSE